MVSSADRMGLVFPLRAMLGLAFHSFRTPQEILFASLPEFPMAPFPPPHHLENQASHALSPAILPPPSFACKQNASSSFGPSLPPPWQPDFHSDHLLRVARALLAARPKGVSSAKCTAMAPQSGLMLLTSTARCSSQPPPPSAPPDSHL